MRELLHIGIKGRVLAFDRRTGEQRWETPLKGAGFVNVSLEGNQLFAASKGELWCLDPVTGNTQWHNGLPGMGWGYVAFASSPDKNLAAIRSLIEDERQASAAAT